MTESSTESLCVTPEMLHTRLDRLLVQSFPQHSRTYFQYLIESRLVLVNGKPVKKRETFEIGDEIEVCFELTPESSLIPENIPLDIVYEDEFLIAVNKPAGMVTHPAPGHPHGTFVNALLYHCKNLPQTSPIRPGIVHRLDKETSGLLLAAKTIECHQKLVELFSSRSLIKRYVAICVGNPGDRTIEEPIRRHPTRRQEMHVDPAGKPAISICRVISTHGNLSCVEVQLVTGRTHQIRVHLKHVGTPILGDTVYGRPSVNQKYSIHRQLLHAKTLSLTHPITGTFLELEAPLPSEFHPFMSNGERSH